MVASMRPQSPDDGRQPARVLSSRRARFLIWCADLLLGSLLGMAVGLQLIGDRTTLSAFHVRARSEKSIR